MIIYPEGTFYSRVTVEDIPEIVEEEHLLKGRIVDRLAYNEVPDEITDEIHASLNDTDFTENSIVLRCVTAALSIPK